MTYQRIEEPSELPPAGPLNARAREKQDLDFKTFVDKSQMWEHAKDIAAFANSLGGVLLIGADSTTDPTVLKYPGVRGQTVADVVRIYEEAGKMCSPAQNVDVVPVKGPDSVDLVAVNVDPSVHQVVASPGGHEKATGISQHLWRFPIRRGSLTDDIAPEDLAMHMNQQARRAFLMVARIPPDKRPRVLFYFQRSTSGHQHGPLETGECELRLVDAPRERNFIVVDYMGTQCRIPLSDILDVWEKNDEVWAIKVSGTLNLATQGRAPLVTYYPRF